MTSYWYPGDVIAPGPVTPPAWNRNAKPGELAAPLANDANVNAAYQALMGWIGQADLQRGNYSRQLTDNLALSQQNRAKAQQAAHQALADRGLLDSGAALTGDADIMSQYDRYDTGLRSDYDTGINALDYKTTGLTDAYENAQIGASGQWTRDQAQAAADALEATRNQSLVDQQIQALMDAIGGASATIGGNAMPVPPPLAPVVTPTAARAAAKPRVLPKPQAPVSGQTGYLRQAIKQGPQ
jgi:hypothetical protein